MSYGRRPPDTDGMISLKVDNLTYRTTVDDLRRAFEKYGDVGDVYIPRDRFTNESRGFAFVRFMYKKDAEDALDRMDGKILDGRELRVAFAKYGRPSHDSYRRPRGRGGYGGGGYGGRRRYRSRSRSRSDSRSRRSRSRSRDRRRSRRSRSRSRSNSYSRSRSRSASRSRSRDRSRSKSRSRTPNENGEDSFQD